MLGDLLLIVASPDATHTPRALTHGVSVLVKKLLTITSWTWPAFVNTTERQASSRARGLVAHNLCFTALHTRVRRLITDSAIDTVTGGHLDNGWQSIGVRRLSVMYMTLSGSLGWTPEPRRRSGGQRSLHSASSVQMELCTQGTGVLI
ncbi:hypothetical protein [Streptomyces sp. NPDC060010]|uniref:hypothetical protein n=1 Tax=Streptomyces sp. NPDC060010 TaxID=3347036 RepID=UPI0036A747D2